MDIINSLNSESMHDAWQISTHSTTLMHYACKADDNYTQPSQQQQQQQQKYKTHLSTYSIFENLLSLSWAVMALVHS